MSIDYKRYVVLENGHKFFNKGIPFGDEWLYERMGYDHIYNLYLDVVCHKSATLRCDYLHGIGFDRYPIGESKVLTYELKSTDIAFSTFQYIFNHIMPWEDPDFKETERQFYDVECPKRFQEHKEMMIDSRRKEFRRKYKKKPTKKDMEEIVQKVNYHMMHFYITPVISPGLSPEYNCAEVDLYEKTNDKDTLEFVTWMKSINMDRPYQRMPNGNIVDYRNIKPSDWKNFKEECKKLE